MHSGSYRSWQVTLGLCWEDTGINLVASEVDNLGGGTHLGQRFVC